MKRFPRDSHPGCGRLLRLRHRLPSIGRTGDEVASGALPFPAIRSPGSLQRPDASSGGKLPRPLIVSTISKFCGRPRPTAARSGSESAMLRAAGVPGLSTAESSGPDRGAIAGRPTEFRKGPLSSMLSPHQRIMLGFRMHWSHSSRFTCLAEISQVSPVRRKRWPVQPASWRTSSSQNS